MAKELTAEESKALQEMGNVLKEVTKPTPKKAKSLSGGSSSDDIKVTSKPVVIEVPPEDVTPGAGEEETTEEESFTSDEVKGAVVEATARVVGKAMVLLTKFPEMDFTPDEIESLKEIWIPVMPSMSPTAMALVGTVVILGSKLATFMVLKGGQKSGQQTAAAQAS